MGHASVRWIGLAAVIAGAAAGGWLALRAGGADDDAPQRREAVRFGLGLQSPGALAALAAARGLFAAEGLDVDVRVYPSGKRALAALLAGEVDVATTAEVPIAFEAFTRNDFAVVATIGAARDTDRVVARRDRGVTSIAELRGRKVGTQRASAVHFFLYVALARHGLRSRDVELVFLPAEALPRALADGHIDAFSMREPYVGQALALLGERAVVFAEPGLYARTEHLVVRRAVLEERPAVARRLVRALLRAEEEAGADPRSAAADAAARLGMAAETLQQAWPDLTLAVGLGQTLLSRLDEEARWMIADGLVEATEAPNYLGVIDVRALAAERPAAVTMIR